MNPLAGLIGQYGDSDDSDEEMMSTSSKMKFDLNSRAVEPAEKTPAPRDGSVQPSPVQHCPWSACYDESSGYTYYWNQHTNEVTWQAPPEYLLALKLAQQQMTTTGAAEVTAEEWQLYQQALAEKQKAKPIVKAPEIKASKLPEQRPPEKISNGKHTNKKRRNSDSDNEKIELITSFSHSDDSDSNNESESPPKKVPEPKPVASVPVVAKVPHKKHKSSKTKPKEFGPSLPDNQNYSVPIGPELPPELMVTEPVASKEEKCPENKKSSPKAAENDDEESLFKQLKDKAKLLEKLGGELPKELETLIKDGHNSRGESPAKVEDNSCDSRQTIDTNIDDLLDEIEKKELPKKKASVTIDTLNENSNLEKEDANEEATSSPKPLFPSSNAITDAPKALFPSAVNIDETSQTVEDKDKSEVSDMVAEKKGTNIYIMDHTDVVSNTNKKRLRLSNSVLPERKQSEVPTYTTKYSQVIGGLSGERTGLGFSKIDEDANEIETPKKTISYGNGLMFTKGETLNEEKKDEDLEDSIDLLEAKLKFLGEQQPYPVSPIQEMAIQLKTLLQAYRASALGRIYLSSWVTSSGASLSALEASAAPAAWRCQFNRSAGRYEYTRECDGHTQFDYPTAANTATDGDDMDICTTPPHTTQEDKESSPPPVSVSGPAPQPPLPPRWSPPPPPPPAWDPPPPPPGTTEPQKEIGDELMSFYNDIAELEKASPPTTASNSPERVSVEPPLPVETPKAVEKEVKKKKSKVKISSTVGMKSKAVSSMVAKWQQVAEEINSD